MKAFDMPSNFKIKNIILTAVFFMLAIITSACSANILNVVANAKQGECVQASEYGSLESQAVAAFPMIAKNPISAPYCVSVTVQNNNSATQGGTNLQVTSPGVVITGLPNESSTPFSMIDPVAANIALNTANQTQTTGNVTIFDPNNCATTTGINTITLQGGQSCKFYLQITSESYPPNVYPMSVAYNYYNGNTNYVVYTSINQRVNLYAGTESGLFIESNSNPTAPAQWSNPSFNVQAAQINSMISDDFGNIYFAIKNQVYLYNGINLSQLGTNFANTVNSLTIDVNGNLYAGTNGSGIYVYNTSTSPNTWVSFTDTNGNLNNSSIIQAISSTGFISTTANAENFYVTTVNQAFKCSILISNTFTTSCAFTNISTLPASPVLFNLNSIDSDNFGNLYTGSESLAYSFIESNNAWQNITFPGNIITGNVAGIYHQNNSSIPLTYMGIINSTSNESATVFNCNGFFQCTPLYSTTTTSANFLTGNAYAITADGAGDVFVGGSMLNSLDFTVKPLNATGAYLYITNGDSTWQPINNGSMESSNHVNSMVISSSLTLY